MVKVLSFILGAQTLVDKKQIPIAGVWDGHSLSSLHGTFSAWWVSIVSSVLSIYVLQYIFVNMFTGVVVENFSYVFQTSGGAKSITREEMRSFKKIWNEYANAKTGVLERHNLVKFFGVS